jgi:hypothetical protein
VILRASTVPSVCKPFRAFDYSDYRSLQDLTELYRALISLNKALDRRGSVAGIQSCAQLTVMILQILRILRILRTL